MNSSGNLALRVFGDEQQAVKEDPFKPKGHQEDAERSRDLAGLYQAVTFWMENAPDRAARTLEALSLRQDELGRTAQVYQRIVAAKAREQVEDGPTYDSTLALIEYYEEIVELAVSDELSRRAKDQIRALDRMIEPPFGIESFVDSPQ